MSKKKTALQRLAFAIAEDVMQLLDTPFGQQLLTAEEIYETVYAALPFDQEDWAAEQEAFDKSMEESGIIRQGQGPTLMQRLREAVHVDKGTTLKVTLEAAIKAAEERDMLLQKEKHGCTGIWCEECQPTTTKAERKKWQQN
jgi:hypothetical protein